jgi:deoxyadenosine/deoxycytidine kinase
MMIWVEGLIGAGKTTFCHAVVAALPELRALEEPVADNPYLERFYLTPKRWAFPMQIDLLFRRFAIQKLAAYESISDSPCQGVLIDRGMPGDRVFAKLHYERGNIDFLEWQTYNRVYKMLACSLLPPSILIYLHVDPRTAMDRIWTRKRKAELALDLDYLKHLQSGYEEMLAELAAGSHPWGRGVEIWKVDWNEWGVSGALIEALRDRVICGLGRVGKVDPRAE